MATKDFFISYSSADRLWAEWIAWQLEEADYSVMLQTQQFQPGQNFVQAMQDAISQVGHTLVVLSPDYLNELETLAEWVQIFRQDLAQSIPVQVRESQDRLKGVLSLLPSIDLIGRDENEAREVLLAEIKRVSSKSSTRSVDSAYIKHTSIEQPEFPINFPRIWNVPPHNRFFTDREKILQNLRDGFTVKGARIRTLSQALSGLGGIGKTQIAIEYAYRYRNEYQAILWAPADSQDTLVQSCHALAKLLDLPGKDELEHGELLEGVRNWLQDHVDWLLILDNADDLSIVRDFLPSATRGHVLITTRAQAVGRVAKGIVVDKMTPEEGGLCLLRRAGLISPGEQLDREDAQCRAAMAIAEIMDGLPLALDQAGGYIEEVECDLMEYLSLYQKYRKQMLGRRGNLIFDHPQPVATTWSLSFEQVQRDNPVAADVLRLCAFFAADDIPEELLTQDVFHEHTTLHALAQNPMAMHEAVAELRRYSLVRRQSEDRTLSIHRLVQAVLRDTLSAEEQQQWARRAVLAVNAAFPEVKFETWSQCQRYLPHARACAASIARWNMDFPQAAHLLHCVAQYLQARAQYAAAAQMFQQAVAIYEQAADQDALAETLNDLASLLVVQGKYVEAEECYRRALTIIEQTPVSEHSDVIAMLNNLLDLYFTQGRYADALTIAQRALALTEKSSESDDPDIATGLINLARAYRELGEFRKAEPLAQRALAIHEQALGPEHPDTAASLNNLASLYQAQGRYGEAEPLYQRALAIDEQVLGPEHPDTAASLNNLASLYQDQEHYTEAEPLYQRALAIAEQVLGPEHPNTAASLNNLASLYQDQERYTEAEPLYQRALAIREQVMGSTHPDTISTRRGLANSLRKMQRNAEAEILEAYDEEDGHDKDAEE